MAPLRTVVLGVLGLAFAKASTISKNCEVPIHHYTELECKPFFSNANSTCPERYECPSILARTDDNKCYFKSKFYNYGERLDRDYGCSYDCFCDPDFGFVCVEDNCPGEDEGWSEPPAEGCVYQKTVNDSFNKICDAEEKTALATCKYGDQTYKEGEEISLDDACMTCICGKGFDGTLKSLQCSEIFCGVEIRNGNEIKERCAPVYFQGFNCCPIEWKCPKSGDKIIHTDQSKKSDDSNMKCMYGKESMDIGDEVMTNEACLKCICRVPPLVSCTKISDCYHNISILLMQYYSENKTSSENEPYLDF